jgi:hypothetical protein
MHFLLPVLLFASTVTVKLDQTQLRSGCEARDESVSALQAGTPVEIRFAMSGSTETCYKVTAMVDGKPLPGYLPASAIIGLETFEQGLKNAPSLEVSREMQSQVAALQAPAASGPPGHPLVRASTLLQEKQPRAALDLVEMAMKTTGRDYQYLLLAGIAAYQSDEAAKALDYLKEAEQLKQDRSVEQWIARLEKEVGSDKSGERLIGNRFLLRYEGGVLDADVARAMVTILEDEFARISLQLGCRTDERIVTIVQSRQAYRASTDSAEWSGGQFDGKIRIPVLETKTIAPQTRKTFAHEIVHACLASFGNWPAWMHEGMAQKLSGETLSPGRRAMVESALRQKTLPKLENMSQSFSRMSTEHALLAYSYSLYAADLLMQRYQAYGIQNILRDPERFPQITAELDKLLGQ